MGGFLNRSTDAHEESYTKKERRKKRHRKLEDATYDGEAYLNGDLNYPYDLWQKEFQQQQMFAMSDPPGAPRTYPSNDLMIQSWSAQQTLNNSFYPMDPSYPFSYPGNQYNPTPIPPPTVPETRVSKKVQFATSHQPEPSLSKPKSTDQSLSLSTRPKKLLTKTPSVPTSIEKPIYVGIDYQATLAERSQTTAPKRHPQAHHKRSHHHPLLTDSPQSNSSQTLISESFPTLPSKVPLDQVRSLSSGIKPRTHRRPQQTSSPINHEKKPSKPRVNHLHQSLSHSSPTARRRIEVKHTGAPVMRISLSQLNQQHSRIRV